MPPARGRAFRPVVALATVFLLSLVLFVSAAHAEPPRLVSFTADKEEITVPEQTTVTATADRSVYNSGYVIAIVDDSTGAANICNTSDKCYRGVYANWYQDQLNPQPAVLHAEIQTMDGEVLERSESIEVARESRFFKVDISFGTYECCGGWSTPTATSRSEPTIHWTGLELRVRRADGALLCSVASSDICGARIQYGDTVRGTVEDPSGQQVFGTSPYYTITEDGPVREEADDIALVPLAARFPTVSALCDWMLTMPQRVKTYVVPGSLSDQDRACQTAAQSSVTVKRALELIATTAGGTAFLWYLAEDVERAEIPREEGDPEPEDDPYPVPPVLEWPDEVQDDADELLRRNQEEFESKVSEPETAARMLIKECRMRMGEYLRKVVDSQLTDRDCVNLPIFVSGDLGVREATQHDWESVLLRPQWLLQNWRAPENNPSPRRWYDSLPQCENKPAGTACHEFPYFQTKQGGKFADPRPRVTPINPSDNSRQGPQFRSGFANRCLRGEPPQAKPIENEQFLVLQAPKYSGLPSLYLCNRPG